MIEKSKEKILASSEAVRSSQPAQSNITLRITSYNSSRKLAEKNVLSAFDAPSITKHKLHHAVLPANFLKFSENSGTATSILQLLLLLNWLITIAHLKMYL